MIQGACKLIGNWLPIKFLGEKLLEFIYLLFNYLHLNA